MLSGNAYESRHDEWSKVISADRLVKFAYGDLRTGANINAVENAAHEVMYSISAEQTERPLQSRGRGRSLLL